MIRDKGAYPKGQRPSKLNVEARLELARVGGYAELFDAVLLCCRQICGDAFVECALGLIDPENSEFYFPLRSHLPLRPPMKKPLDDEPDMLTLGLASDESLVFVDKVVGAQPYSNEPLQPRQERPFEARQLPPWITIPIMSRRKRLGVMAARVQPWEGGGSPPFMPELERLAAEVALAAAICHRHEQREQSLRDHHDIFRISSRLQSIRVLDELLSEILDALVRSFGFDRAVVLLLDEDEGPRTLRWAASTGSGQAASAGCDDYGHAAGDMIAPHGVLAQALGDGFPRVIRSPRADHAAPEFLRSSRDACQAAILPLLAKGHPLGLICADHRFDRGQVGSRRLATLGLFANQAALAVENVRLYTRVDTMAKTDSLTKLFNRHYFDEAFQREIARLKRHGQNLCLMMVDLRGFKRLNDVYGHLAGDEMLRKVARTLKERVRAYDIVARFGGDEFVILMPDTNLQQAGWVRARIEEAMRKANESAKSDAERIELSIGLRMADANEPETVLADADTAMYEDRTHQSRQQLIRVLMEQNWAEVDRADPFIGNVLRVLNEKEPFYLAHARRVTSYALGIAQRLELPAEKIELACLGALLHDLGKVALNAQLLQKHSTLTPREYQVVKTHTTLGADLLKGAGGLEAIGPIVKHHHERYDGRITGQFPGYPDAIAGDAIPLGARIIKVADCFDFLTSSRPYHIPISWTEAIQIIQDDAGRAFDPHVVEAFVSYLEVCSKPLSRKFSYRQMRRAMLRRPPVPASAPAAAGQTAP